MALLQLPVVLFEQTVDVLMQNSHDLAAMKGVMSHRLVCRTFNDFITARAIECMARKRGTCPPFSYEGYGYLFRFFGTGIMQRKITLGVDKEPLIQNLTQVVDVLVACDWPQTLDVESAAQIRAQYLKNVCEALRVEKRGLRSLEDMFRLCPKHNTPGVYRAAFAAIGNAQMFLNRIKTIQDVLSPTKSFSNALNASVAGNQIDTVQTILVWLLSTVEGLWETENKLNLYSVSKGLIDAFIIAVPYHRDAIGKLILSAFTKHPGLAESVGREDVYKLYQSCVNNGNLTFFLVAFNWKRNGDIVDSTEIASPELLNPWEFDFLLQHGTEFFLRSLIRSKKINPNLLVRDPRRPRPETTLSYVMTHLWYRAAEVLLEEGVDIDGVAPGDDRSAYWEMRDRENGDAQWFLINRGADTRAMWKHGTPQDPEQHVKPDIYDYRDPCDYERYYPNVHDRQYQWDFHEYEPLVYPGDDVKHDSCLKGCFYEDCANGCFRKVWYR